MEASAAASETRRQGDMGAIIAASSAGTAFEWYDFFVFGTQSAIISRNFFAQLDETAGLLASLALFGAGFLFRPIGALVFGRLGDRFGRKGAFLTTVLLMGGATFAIGLLPNFSQGGVLGSVLLIILRIVQGMAVGGEYGGAAIYVAEHAPVQRRGEMTGWIQSSAAMGLIGALAVVLITRTALGEAAFGDWGWRIPFLVSAILVAISIWMRLKLTESPEFSRLRDEGKIVKAPYAEAFLRWPNLKIVLIALFSLMLAQGAIWWAAFFFSQIFLENFLKTPPVVGNVILIVATIVSVPFYVAFGALSDRIGRKPVMAAGIALSLIAIFPAFHGLAQGANPALVAAQARSPVTLKADLNACSFQFDLLGRAAYETSCDVARNILTKAGVSFTTQSAAPGAVALVVVGGTEIASAEGVGLDKKALGALRGSVEKRIKTGLVAAGYPSGAEPNDIRWVYIGVAMLVLVVGATALYGPLAAALVELFPSNVRYTALSVPYHIGVGWVGGLMPMTAFAIAAATGNIYAGLWYTVAFGGISLVTCLLTFPETRGRPLDHGG